MVAAVIFVLAFLVLGLGVVFFAFSGRAARALPARRAHARRAPVRGGRGRDRGRRPRGRGAARHRPGQPQRPCQERAGRRGPHRLRGAGRAVFAKYCSTCHTLKASNAVGKVGPNLDVLHPAEGAHPRRDRQGSRARPGPDARRAGRRRRTRRTSPPTWRRSPAADSAGSDGAGRRRPATALVAAATWAENRPVGARDSLVECAPSRPLSSSSSTVPRRGKGGEAGDPKVGANRVVRRVAQALSARARQLTP